MATNTVNNITASTATSLTSNGTTGPYSLNFEYATELDVEVFVNGVKKTRITDYTFTTASQITFTSAPANGASILIQRNTQVSSTAFIFQDGSVLSATELNNINTQLLHAIQELVDDYVKKDGSVPIRANLVFEGSTNDANETTLAITDPTADRTITIPDITGTLVTTGDTGTVTSTMINDGTIVNADINASADISGSKLADDSVTLAKLGSGALPTDITVASSNIVDGTIVDADINSSANIAGTKLADDSVTLAKLGSGALPTDITVASANIVDGTIVNADINASASIDGTKISPNFGSQNITTTGNATVGGTLGVTGNSTLSGTLTITGSIDANGGAVIDNIQIGITNDNEIDTVSGNLTIDSAGGTTTIDDDLTVSGNSTLSGTLEVTGTSTLADVSGGAVVTSGTSTSDTKVYSAKRAGEIFYGKDTVSEIQSGETWSSADDKIATTAAIDARVIDLVDDVGGFVPIASETVFPNTNPDVNNGTGTLVSIKEIGSTRTPSGGTVTIANGNVANNATITITGCGSTVLTAGFGIIVETTSTLHTYTFHRLTPKATEVTTVAGIASNITAVANNSTNINAVASNQTNINAVNNNSTNINAVAGKATEIGRLGTADAVADMAILGTTDVVADMNTLGTADVVADMNMLATSDVVSDMNTLAVTDVINDMDTVATNVTNVNNVGGSITNVNNVAGSLSNVNTVAGSISNVNTVGGDISNVNTVAGSISNVNTVASNISNVNSFFNTYRIGANNPTNSLDTGDLFFNTTSNSLKVYTGSAWVDGVTATGNFALKTGNTFTGSNIHNDNVKSIYGTSSDGLEIFHNGSDSIIDDVGTGTLKLQLGGATKLEVQSGGVGVTGDIVVSGNVDGRDVAADGTKLDGIESNATADQTKSDIDALGIAASTATTLANARTIAGTSFDGSANIDINYNNLTNKPTIPTNNNELTNGAGYITATLTNEQVQDIVGAMLSGNTETGITVTYQDSDGTIDFAVATQSDNNLTNALLAILNGLSSSAGVLSNGVTATTQSASDNSTKVATTAYTDTAISNLVDSAPGTLNTLNELAAALGDDASFSTTVTNSIATKLPLAGGQMTGNITFSGSQTVDGRDLSVDGSKLDGIAANAIDGSSLNASNLSSGTVPLARIGNGFLTQAKMANNSIGTNQLINDNVTLAKIENFDSGRIMGRLASGSGDATQLTAASVRSIINVEDGATADQTKADIDALNINADQVDGVDASGFVRTNNGAQDINGSLTCDDIIVAGAMLHEGDTNTLVHFTANDEISMKTNGSTRLKAHNSGVDVTGALVASGDVTAFSDETLKTDINTINDALSTVGKLRGVSYKWKENNKPSIGVIAQEVEQIIPELVHTSEHDGKEVKSVDYGKMVGVLIEAIKELKAEVEELKGAK